MWNSKFLNYKLLQQKKKKSASALLRLRPERNSAQNGKAQIQKQTKNTEKLQKKCQTQKKKKKIPACGSKKFKLQSITGLSL